MKNYRRIIIQPEIKTDVNSQQLQGAFEQVFSNKPSVIHIDLTKKGRKRNSAQDSYSNKKKVALAQEQRKKLAQKLKKEASNAGISINDLLKGKTNLNSRKASKVLAGKTADKTFHRCQRVIGTVGKIKETIEPIAGVKMISDSVLESRIEKLKPIKLKVTE